MQQVSWSSNSMANLFNKPISTNPPTALEIKQSEQLVQVLGCLRYCCCLPLYYMAQNDA